MSGASADKRAELLGALQRLQASRQALALRGGNSSNSSTGDSDALALCAPGAAGPGGAGAGAGAYGLMMGLWNRAENSRLARRQDALGQRLDAGERVLGELRIEVAQQGESMGDIAEQVQEQEGSLQELERKVAAQRREMERLAVEYQREMEDQRRLLQAQRLEFGRIMLSRLKQDATLDAVIVLFAWIVSKSPLVGAPVRLLSLATGAVPLVPLGRRARSDIVASASRTLVVLFLARSMRIVAARHGLHNSVGGPNVYLMQLLLKAQEKVPAIKAYMPETSLHDDAEPRPPTQAQAQAPPPANVQLELLKTALLS